MQSTHAFSTRGRNVLIKGGFAENIRLFSASCVYHVLSNQYFPQHRSMSSFIVHFVSSSSSFSGEVFFFLLHRWGSRSFCILYLLCVMYKSTVIRVFILANKRVAKNEINNLRERVFVKILTCTIE